MDILITNARLRRREGLFNIAIADGKIAGILPVTAEVALASAPDRVLDAAGGLVTESFCNAHLHLCKVWTLQRMDEAALKDYQGADMGKAMTAIELAARVKASYDEGWILENVRRALDLAAQHGNLHIRAFADVDSKAKLIGVQALLKAREEYRGRVTVQVVAFPQDGLLREPGAEELVRQAVELGADVVGGIPWIEYTDEDARAHVQKMVALAREFDRDVSMLVDDAGDPTLKTLEMLAVEAIRQGMVGRCLAQHARAMCLYPMPYFTKLVALLKKAQLGVVTDPQTGPLHARVQELLAAGANVCLGQDDISDAYYPYGRNNMLEVAFLASHLLWMTGAAEMETLYDMITTRAADAMNVRPFGLAEGNPAHLVVLGVPSVLEALRGQAAPRYVVSHGKLVAETRTEVTLHKS